MSDERGMGDRPKALDDTVETVLIRHAPQSSSQELKAQLVAGSGPRLETEIQSLLRRRMRLAVLVLLAADLFFTGRAMWNAGWPVDLAARSMSSWLLIAVLIGGAWMLWSRWTLSLIELRAIELAIFGVMGILMAMSQQRQLARIASPDEVESTVRLLTMRWFGLVLVYSMFIPNGLVRAVSVVGAMCLVPVVLVGGTALEHEPLGSVVFHDGFYAEVVVLMGIAFATGVYGSYKSGVLRREAFEARQLGQYRLTERLGSGGMGEVYLAEHRLLKRPCAVKLIRPSAATDPKSLARFEREVRAIARLTHWNTVEIFDYGRTDDGTFFYAMEYLPGLSLQEVVERQGPLQSQRAVHLMRQVCDALTEAHALGLVHRDIKPSNIIASQRGGVYDVAKVVDFGLATSIGDDQEMRLTQDGSIAGTPHFLAPERYLEDGDPDARSDIYSLGAVLYFLLTGRPPFVGDKAIKVMIAHAREVVVPPSQINPSVPKDLEQVILRCLAKEPAQRYADAPALGGALAQCQCADCWTQEMAQRWWASRETPAEVEAPAEKEATTQKETPTSASAGEDS